MRPTHRLARCVWVARLLGLGLCEDWCRIAPSHSSLTRRLRDKFHKKDGFASCALVGSSGLLLQERLGAQIDAHEFVLRTNLAPIGGFEDVVGTKTTVRVMNTEALETVLLERACPELRHGRTSFCPRYSIYVNSEFDGPKLRTELHHACPVEVSVLGRSDVPTWDPVRAPRRSTRRGATPPADP